MSSTTTISDITGALQAKTTTALETVKKALSAAHAEESNALLEILDESALKKAARIDEQIASGEAVGPLAGVPFIAKDNYVTSVGHTTAASKILELFEGPYQSTAITKLESAGAILIAKANLDAFAHGSTTENSDFGPTTNPHDSSRVPGGSSGGSAAAVALDIVPFALGTDTGGSIRLPASFCGVVGLKPTYGLVSRFGVIAMASSTDCMGPLAHSVDDIATVLEIMSGRDARDGTSIDRDPTGYLVDEVSVRGKKFGLVKQFMEAGLEAEVRAAIESVVEKIKANGGEVIEYDLPSIDLALAAYYTIVPAEISSNLARYDGIRYGLAPGSSGTVDDAYTETRSTGFNDENKRRIIIGTFVTSSGYHDAYYLKAQTVRSKLIAEFREAFSTVDFLIGPVAAQTAFPIHSKDEDPLSMYLTDVMTVAANLVGVPSISLPLPVSGLPIGLQIMADQRQDKKLLQAAKAVEEIL